MVVSCLWPAVVGEVDATFGNQALSHDNGFVLERTRLKPKLIFR